MTIPGRREAAFLLRALDPPPWFLRHACAVADVAGWLAERIEANGHPVGRRLTEAAALLHDVDKLPGASMPHQRHGEGSAAWLAARGLGELADAVRDHPVTRLAEPAWAGWLLDASLEARVVAYADKRAGQRLEPMEQRFASWRRRYPAGPAARLASDDDAPSRGGGWNDDLTALVERRARELERDVCGLAGVAPKAVGRLRWSRRALRDAA